jgi:hypothetical protein
MYNFKQPVENNIIELEDGFERYGDRDSPFLIRGGGEKRVEAESIHRDRDQVARREDELTNEPVTRDLEEWENNIDDLDFPHVDSIPHDILEDRAQRAANVALGTGIVDDIDNDADIEGETRYGTYWSGYNEIKLDTDDSPLLSCRRGPVLAHEVGHAVYDKLDPGTGIDPGIKVFETTAQREEAENIARRLHGPFIQPDADQLKDVELTEIELFAYVFESICIEADAALREAPNAVSRVDRLLSRDDFDPRFGNLLDQR